jgi:hypothetical protein
VRSFDTLHDLGYHIEDPRNFNTTHMDVLVKHWADTLKLAPKTFQSYRSAMSVFCGWLGKRDIVKPTRSYQADGRSLICTQAAQRDKSWDGNGLDVMKVIGELFADAPVVGAQLMAMQAFGLRPKEALMLRPLTCIHERELHVIQGSKSGRTRVIPIETDEQRWTANWLKEFVKERGVEHLGWKYLSLEQSYWRMFNTFKACGLSMAKLGVTSYGLRHQFIHALMARHGITPAVKGGTADQASKERIESVYTIAAVSTGHARPQITTAYSGSFGRPPEATSNGYAVTSAPNSHQTPTPTAVVNGAESSRTSIQGANHG